MSRKLIIAANWKMNMTPQETTEFIKQFQTLVGNENKVDIVIAPPFVSISAAAEVAPMIARGDPASSESWSASRASRSTPSTATA